MKLARTPAQWPTISSSVLAPRPPTMMLLDPTLSSSIIVGIPLHSTWVERDNVKYVIKVSCLRKQRNGRVQTQIHNCAITKIQMAFKSEQPRINAHHNKPTRESYTAGCEVECPSIDGSRLVAARRRVVSSNNRY